MRIIANYLPQFHEIPQNDQWWGKGFTDWYTARNAAPLFEGHRQPRVPLNDNYYDLSNVDNIRWQAELAAKYGVYGFGIYHYWFNSNLKLLEKPAELLRDHQDISIHYLFIWDNVSWARTWSNKKFKLNWMGSTQEPGDKEGDGILAELVYGNKSDWKTHFDYLNTFFKDPRYIKIDNKPVFAIFNQNNNPDVLKKMVEYWNELAINNGYSGIMVIGKKNWQNINISDYQLYYEPLNSTLQPDDLLSKGVLKVKGRINLDKRPNFYNYDRAWRKILINAKKSGNKKIFYSGFIDYDDSPRHGVNGRIFLGGNPRKLEMYLSRLLQISHDQGKEYVFLTAWNEWGEGAYLEPDSYYKYEYLEAVKKALETVKGRPSDSK